MKTQCRTALLLLLCIISMSSAIAAEKRPSTKVDGVKFLANYTNPEQEKLPADGIYPLGQRMMIGTYSTNGKQLRKIIAAGFTMDGPHYAGEAGPP